MNEAGASMSVRQPLLEWAKKSDHWFIFRPSRWPHRELVSRATALVIIAGILALRLSQFQCFPGTYASEQAVFSAFKAAGGNDLYTTAQIAGLWGIKLTVWSIETLIYLGYVASYVSRVKAVDIAKGFMETAFPIIVAGTPLFLSFFPYSLPRWIKYGSAHHATYYLATMVLIVAGGLLNLIGLLTLRRAFTIMTEARTLITRGIFGFIRHPLYTGHFIMFFGSMLLRLDWTATGLYLFFLVGQVMRAKLEERKLSRVFPEYDHYRRSTGMFFPKRISFKRRS